jgi:molybdopterin biosynthesis enzyme
MVPDVITAEGKEELEIEVLCTTPVGDNVRQPGSDAKKGSKVLDAGTVIGSGGGEVGLLGFVGKREVSTISGAAPHRLLLTSFVGADSSYQKAKGGDLVNRE